ncbi:MAG: Rv0340 family protein [Mycobacteriaceae bacterium]|nr:Rv0340 family protein [Mycobacteriaceae bacterium]
MANELLDFVMSLVRDPDALARYQADPTQAIADAHLTDVTSADVHSLMPVVSESLSMAAPITGADAGHDSNIWASGAATAAFDAFADHVPDQAVDAGHQLIADPVDHPVDQPAVDVADVHTVDAGGFDHPAPVDDFHIDHIDDPTPVVDDVQPVDHPLIPDHDLGGHEHGWEPI